MATITESAFETVIRERFPDAVFCLPLAGYDSIFRVAMVTVKPGWLKRLWLWVRYLGQFEYPLVPSDFMEAPFNIEVDNGRRIRGNIIVPNAYLRYDTISAATAAELARIVDEARETVDKLLAEGE